VNNVSHYNIVVSLCLIDHIIKIMIIRDENRNENKKSRNREATLAEDYDSF